MLKSKTINKLKMKNFNFYIINGVLAIAIIALYILFLLPNHRQPKNASTV